MDTTERLRILRRHGFTQQLAAAILGADLSDINEEALDPSDVPALPGVDLTPLEDRLTTLEDATPVDLTPLEDRLTTLEDAPGVDLAPLEGRVTTLEDAPAPTVAVESHWFGPGGITVASGMHATVTGQVATHGRLATLSLTAEFTGVPSPAANQLAIELPTGLRPLAGTGPSSLNYWWDDSAATTKTVRARMVGSSTFVVEPLVQGGEFAADDAVVVEMVYITEEPA